MDSRPPESPLPLRSHGSKENAYQPNRALVSSVYNKDRQPLHGILRNNNDSLKENFSRLEGEMEDYKSQQRARIEGLGRSVMSQKPTMFPAEGNGTETGATAAGCTKAFPNEQLLSSKPQPGCLESNPLSVAPALAERQHEKLVNIPAGDTSKIAKAASASFEDPELQKQCHEGLTMELTRTKDGATDATKIQELAALTKLLRKCVRTLCGRVSTYVSEGMKIERELHQQMEAVKLAGNKTAKELEAEIASLKLSLAQNDSRSRDEEARLAGERDRIRMLEREKERLAQERNEARDVSKALESQRLQLELEIKELRKLGDQQARQVALLSASQDETTRQLTEEKAALESRMASVQDEADRLRNRLAAAEDCHSVFEAEVKGLRTMIENLNAVAKGKDASAAAQAEQLAMVQVESSQFRAKVSSLEEERQRLHFDLQRAEDQRTELTASLDQRLAQLKDLQEVLRVQENNRQEEAARWEARAKEYEAALTEAATAQAALLEQKKGLLSALQLAAAGGEAEKERADKEASERAALLREHTNVVHQLEFTEGRVTAADQAAAELRSKIEELQAQLAERQQMLEAKDTKIEHLEGEFAALKEVLGDTAGGEGESGRDIVTKLLSKIATLQSNAAAAEAVRRKLHNELVDLRGNIRVYCRVRPHDTPATRIGPDGTSISVSVDNRDHTFAFDRVFGPDSTQDAVFRAVSELIQSALDGYHVCIFSYGQTGAGKTHTMQGGASPDSRGIIPRAIEKILSARDKLQEEDGWRYTLASYFVEVYNSGLRDLLGGGNAGVTLPGEPIKHDPTGGHTTIMGAKRVEVGDTQVAAQIMQQAAAARAVDATAMNAASSRSHSVFMLNIQGWHDETKTQLQGSLCLVDLAGSERLARSQAEGDAKKETCAINSSLSALGDVFTALSTKAGHVPYRNSKLTYLLQPCLGGSGKTLMVVNINPEPASAKESLCSLRFAAKVSGCETGAKGGARRNVLTLGGTGPGMGSGAGPSGAAGDSAGEARRRGTGAAAAGPATVQPAAGAAAAAPAGPPGVPGFHVGRQDPPAVTRPRQTGSRPPVRPTTTRWPPPGPASKTAAPTSNNRRATISGLPTYSAAAAAAASAAGSGAAAPGGSRFSLSGVPRPGPDFNIPGGAAKRMSMAPQRGVAPAAGAGVKRPATGVAPGNVPKRPKP